MASSIAIPTRTLLFLAILLFIGLGGLYAWVFLPAAHVTISPALVERDVVQEISVSTSVEDPDFVRFRLPARTVGARVERDEIITRDEGATSDDFAKGELTLVNLQSEEQQLLPNTHLRHEESGVFFLTDTPVAIPPGGEVRMTVTAKEQGKSGNVAAGRFIIDKLAPSLHSRIYGESATEMTGGLAVEEPISADELQRQTDELLGELREEVRGQLTVETGGATLREDLLAFTAEEVNRSVEPGSKALTYTLRGVVEAKAFLLDDNDLLGLTILTLRSAASPDEEFVTYDPLSFSATLLRSDFDGGEALIEGKLRGSFATKLAPTVFSESNLAGLAQEEVIERLQDLPGVGDVAVEFTPFWVNSVPSRAGAVTVEVMQAQGARDGG